MCIRDSADDDRDTAGTCDIDLDDNRGGMVEHIVEQVPDCLLYTSLWWY